MTEDFITLIVKKLEEFSIDYLIVGGCAAIFYNRKKYTTDLDVLIRNDDINYENFSMFLATLNYQIDISTFANNGILRINARPFSIDFHSKLDGIDIAEAFSTFTRYQLKNKVALKIISDVLLQKNLLTVKNICNAKLRN